MQEASLEIWPGSGTLTESQEILLCKCLSYTKAEKIYVSCSTEQSLLTRGFWAVVGAKRYFYPRPALITTNSPSLHPNKQLLTGC